MYVYFSVFRHFLVVIPVYFTLQLLLQSLHGLTNQNHMFLVMYKDIPLKLTVSLTELLYVHLPGADI